MRGKVLRRLNPVQLIQAVREVIEEHTGLECCTNPNDKESPFYAIALSATRPVKSKTMRLEDFDLDIHAISVPSESQTDVLGMVASMEEAVEACPELCPPWHVVSVTENGLVQCVQDPTSEWHAVVSYTVRVSYGLLIK